MHNNMLETGVFSCKIKIELCLKKLFLVTKGSNFLKKNIS